MFKLKLEIEQFKKLTGARILYITSFDFVGEKIREIVFEALIEKQRPYFNTYNIKYLSILGKLEVIEKSQKELLEIIVKEKINIIVSDLFINCQFTNSEENKVLLSSINKINLIDDVFTEKFISQISLPIRNKFKYFIFKEANPELGLTTGNF